LVAAAEQHSTDSFTTSSSRNSENTRTSTPATVTVHVRDENDHGPVLRMFDEGGEEQGIIRVVDGRLNGPPFLVAVEDADVAPENRRNGLSLMVRFFFKCSFCN
jgi:hypothetical protein